MGGDRKKAASEPALHSLSHIQSSRHSGRLIGIVWCCSLLPTGVGETRRVRRHPDTAHNADRVMVAEKKGGKPTSNQLKRGYPITAAPWW